MANGTIVNVWRENGSVCLAVTVAEAQGNVEYIGRVPDDAAFAALSTAQKRTALVAACKAVRDAQTTVGAGVPSITGAVTL